MNMSKDYDIDTLASDSSAVFATKSRDYLAVVDARIAAREEKLADREACVTDSDPLLALLVELKNDIVRSMEEGVEDLFQIIDIMRDDKSIAV